MTNASIRQWLDLWHSLLDDPSIAPFHDPDDMAGVLADLRKRPDKLAAAFKPLPHGEALLARVERCIKGEIQPVGSYLDPKSIAASDEELIALVKDALELGCKCCDIDVPQCSIHIIRRAMTTEESSSCAPLIEELGDQYIAYAHTPRGRDSDAMLFLGEALYTLAASNVVRDYCLTPLCPDEARQIDPYRPQVELWFRRAQAVCRWDSEDREWIDVFVG